MKDGHGLRKASHALNGALIAIPRDASYDNLQDRLSRF